MSLKIIKQIMHFLWSSNYFNNKILDIQIYNQVYQKIAEANLDISYLEVLYNIYRESFPPNKLNLFWMHKLTISKNEEFINKLKNDYQLLKQAFPQRLARSSKRRQGRQSKLQKEQDKSIQNERKQGKPVKILKQSLPSVELPAFHNLQNTQPLTPEQIFRMKLSTEVKAIMSQLSLDVSNFNRVIVHNVEIQFSNEQQYDDDNDIENENEQDNMGMDEQNFEFDEHEIPPLPLNAFDISKIKIGKIQFISDKIKDN